MYVITVHTCLSIFSIVIVIVRRRVLLYSYFVDIIVDIIVS